MRVAQLQSALDQTRSTTGQRWLIAVTSIASIVIASAAIARASTFADNWVVFFVAFLAVVVAVEPDEHLGLVLMCIVAFHWLMLGQDVTSPWAMGLAACFHVFHSSVALMAVAPHTAVVHRDVIKRWLGNSVVVAAATLGVWALVVMLDRREAPGSVALSVLAFAVLAAAVVGFRAQSLAPRQPR